MVIFSSHCRWDQLVLLGVLIQPLLLQAWWYTHPAWPAGSEDNTSSQRAPLVSPILLFTSCAPCSIRNLASKYMQPSEQLAAAALGYRADGSNDPKQADMPELRSLLLAPVALQFGLGSADDAEARMARDSSTHGQPWASAFGAMQRKDGGATSSLTGLLMPLLTPRSVQRPTRRSRRRSPSSVECSKQRQVSSRLLIV